MPDVRSIGLVRGISLALGISWLSVQPTAAAAEPVWTSASTYHDAAKAYPPRARAARVGGSAVVTCTVSPSGTLRTCGVLAETPGG
jgi:hypothetical protein